VPPLPDAFVVNVGDMLETWTNGEFVATTHRVRRVREERYSFPLFFCVDYQTPIAPLPRFVRPDRPARPGFVAGEHLFAQTAQSFGYLKRRLASGDLALPDGSLALSSSARRLGGGPRQGGPPEDRTGLCRPLVKRELMDVNPVHTSDTSRETSGHAERVSLWGLTQCEACLGFRRRVLRPARRVWSERYRRGPRAPFHGGTKAREKP